MSDFPGESATSGAGGWISDLPLDLCLVNRLYELETHFNPRPEFIPSIDLTARQHSVNWILEVHMRHGFRPETAYLAISYFDRILSSDSLPKNGWPLQLLAVACLSLAAKMEESCVPVLADLQIFVTGILFDPKTVQRMELLVLDRLSWQLRSITPFDYLNYFVSKLTFIDLDPDLGSSVLSASSDLILNTCRVTDFLNFPPSTISAAALLSIAGKRVHFPDAFYDKELVNRCHQLMEKHMVHTCHSSDNRNLAVDNKPPSPIDALDTKSSSSSSKVQPIRMQSSIVATFFL